VVAHHLRVNKLAGGKQGFNAKVGHGWWLTSLIKLVPFSEDACYTFGGNEYSTTSMIPLHFVDIYPRRLHDARSRQRLQTTLLDLANWLEQLRHHRRIQAEESMFLEQEYRSREELKMLILESMHRASEDDACALLADRVQP
jgi:hypothetical protein